MVIVVRYVADTGAGRENRTGQIKPPPNDWRYPNCYRITISSDLPTSFERCGASIRPNRRNHYVVRYIAVVVR